MAIIFGNSSMSDLNQKMTSGGIYGGHEPQSVGVANTVCIESPDSDWFFKDVVTNNAANRVVASVHKHSDPLQSYLAFYDPLTLEPVGVGTTVVPNNVTTYELKFNKCKQFTYENIRENVQIVNTFSPVPHQDKFVALAEDTEGILHIAFFDMDGNLQKVWRPNSYGQIVDTEDPNNVGVALTSQGAYGPITTGSKYGSVQMKCSNSIIAIGRTFDSAKNYDDDTRSYYSGTGDGLFLFKFAYPATFYGPRFIQNIPPPASCVKDFWPEKIDMDSTYIVTSARGGDSGSVHGQGSFVRVHDINGNLQAHIGDYGPSYNPELTDQFTGMKGGTSDQGLEGESDGGGNIWVTSSSSNGSPGGGYPVHDPEAYEGSIFNPYYTRYDVGSVGDVAVSAGKLYVGLIDQPNNVDTGGMLEVYQISSPGTDRFEKLSNIGTAQDRIPHNDSRMVVGDEMGRDIHVGSGRIVWGSPVGSAKYQIRNGTHVRTNSGKVFVIATDFNNDWNSDPGGSLPKYDIFTGNDNTGLDGVIGKILENDGDNQYWTVKHVRSGLITLATVPPLGDTTVKSRIKILRTPDSVHIFDIVDQK